jgi:hypothetical protein
VIAKNEKNLDTLIRHYGMQKVHLNLILRKYYGIVLLSANNGIFIPQIFCQQMNLLQKFSQDFFLFIYSSMQPYLFKEQQYYAYKFISLIYI